MLSPCPCKQSSPSGFVEGPPQRQRTRRLCPESVRLIPSVAGTEHLGLGQDVSDAWSRGAFKAEPSWVTGEDGKWCRGHVYSVGLSPCPWCGQLWGPGKSRDKQNQSGEREGCGWRKGQRREGASPTYHLGAGFLCKDPFLPGPGRGRGREEGLSAHKSCHSYPLLTLSSPTRVGPWRRNEGGANNLTEVGVSYS